MSFRLCSVPITHSYNVHDSTVKYKVHTLSATKDRILINSSKCSKEIVEAQSKTMIAFEGMYFQRQVFDGSMTLLLLLHAFYNNMPTITHDLMDSITHITHLRVCWLFNQKSRLAWRRELQTIVEDKTYIRNSLHNEIISYAGTFGDYWFGKHHKFSATWPCLAYPPPSAFSWWYITTALSRYKQHCVLFTAVEHLRLSKDDHQWTGSWFLLSRNVPPWPTRSL